MRMTTWTLGCAERHIHKVLCWDYELPYPCETCGGESYPTSEKFDKAPGVIGDDIPGGEVVDHLFPEPRIFYSKTDIKRACNEGGWTRAGDTPKPYNVPWSGKKREVEKAPSIVKNPSAE